MLVTALLCGLLQWHCHLTHLFLQEGFWSWVSGVTDNALYPVMFLHYLETALPNLATGWHRQLFVAGLCLALAYLNYRVREAWSQRLSSLAAVVPVDDLKPASNLRADPVLGLACLKFSAHSCAGFMLQLCFEGSRKTHSGKHVHCAGVAFWDGLLFNQCACRC